MRRVRQLFRFTARHITRHIARPAPGEAVAVACASPHGTSTGTARLGGTDQILPVATPRRAWRTCALATALVLGAGLAGLGGCQVVEGGAFADARLAHGSTYNLAQDFTYGFSHGDAALNTPLLQRLAEAPPVAPVESAPAESALDPGSWVRLDGRADPADAVECQRAALAFADTSPAFAACLRARGYVPEAEALRQLGDF